MCDGGRSPFELLLRRGWRDRAEPVADVLDDEQ